MDTTPAVVPAKNPAKRVIPPRPLRAAVIVTSFTALLYLIELVDLGPFGGRLDQYGIRPRTLDGLPAVLWAPLLHVNWAHLAGNTIPVLVFGFLAMAGGLGQWIAVTATVWIVSGLGVWLIAPSGYVTVGASGVAFGWLAFLLVRGLFNRSFAQVVVALVLLFYWGSVLWGLLPGRPDISWQGHLFGAIGGIIAAFLASRANRPAKAAPPRSDSGTGVPGSLAA